MWCHRRHHECRRRIEELPCRTSPGNVSAGVECHHDAPRGLSPRPARPIPLLLWLRTCDGAKEARSPSEAHVPISTLPGLNVLLDVRVCADRDSTACQPGLAGRGLGHERQDPRDPRADQRVQFVSGPLEFHGLARALGPAVSSTQGESGRAVACPPRALQVGLEYSC